MSAVRRPSPNALALLALAVVAAVVLLVQRPWAGTAGDEAVLPDDPAAAVREQLAEVSDALSGAPGAIDGLAPAMGDSAEAREMAAALATSVDVTGVSGVTLRLVSLAPAPDGADGSHAARTLVTWQRTADSVLGAGEVRSIVELRLQPRDSDGFDLVGAVAAPGEPLPVWLSGTVSVTAVEGATVLRVDGGTIDTLDAMAARARTQVATVLGDTSLGSGPGEPPIVLVDPGSSARAAALLGRSPSELEGIAGVSTRLDGARAVVLNPDEFATMDQRARQVVVTHEMVHLVTDAIASTREPWVVEGFADWVALHGDTAPLSVSAGQALDRVRSSGAPATLPTAADFAGEAAGAVYESAWLALVVLAELTSDAAVVSFYGDVLAGVPVDEALARIGTDPATLTARWQVYLTYSASTMS